ncbi:recombinase family protein [Aggregatibacter actinomycetemcomitans]|uniref:recombinase family protein n=1 Tax=Aggregatibacter actinomycetemcomitans TaxID=714 RepID=UPI00023FFF3E|nr:recombinase family protein [Aggregatibacter actinomycetemcomitans]EHK90181.1 resolvase [Aggregatibacter actinomycetemcomitans RhAA1]KNE77256.1 resolvase [Aggregatibacter actinomycetemcomitans RhAA1]MBN6078511.1 recombinase family protein [Aggregatibacter actinomycetemcomitans]
MALVGFARASTVGQNYEEQIKQLKNGGCFKIFTGKNSGSKAKNRAILDELLNFVQEGDTVVVTKLDRLGRSTSQILNLYEELESRGIGLKSLDGIIDTEKRTDPFDKVKFVFMAALAEMERNLIRERTMEGRLAKGIEGKGGRPKALIEEQEQSFLLDVKKHFSLAQLSQKYGISRATAYRLRKAHKAS